MILVAALPFTAVSAGAATLDAPTEQKTVNGVTYKKYQYNDGYKQVLFYGEYKPEENSDYEYVIHNIKNSSDAVTLSTVAAIAADYTAKTGRKVIMATNGDYFYNTGSNVDSLVIGGVVYTIGNFDYKHCFGFDNKGNFALGRMTEVEDYVEISASSGTRCFKIDKKNAAPEDGELAIFSAASNRALEGCCKYKVRTDSSNILQFPTDGTATRMATGTVVDDKPLTLSSGEFAVVVKGENEISRFFYDNITYGTGVRLIQKPAGKFAGMEYVVGGYDILVNNGIANTDCHSDNSGDARAPRTFIGVKEDGTVFLSVLDGRNASYSMGCTVNAEAQLALGFGAKYSLELDGGGSSTFLFDFDDGKGLQLLNKPSDGAMRKVSNAVLLVEKEKPQPEDSESDGETPRESASSSGGNGCGAAAGTGAWLVSAAALSIILRKKLWEK